MKTSNLNRWRALFALHLVVTLLVAAASAYAQTYAYRGDVFAYDTPSGAATTLAWHATGAAPACTGFPLGDDDWADVTFPAGFTFTFGGVSYSGVRVYSNGILAFGTDVSGFHRDYTPQALPAPAGIALAGCVNAVPVRVMLAYWIDIVAGTANATTGASLKYELLGTAPGRRFVVSWDNVKLYNQTARYSFQMALFESTAGVNGNFRYQYTTGSSDGSNATVGVQLSATDYTQYSFNQQFIDTTNGTAILWYPANQLIAKAAEYRFDEGAWVGTAGEIRDTSGSNQNASRVGAAANIAAGKLCRGGSFTNNTSNATIDAVATPIVPASVGSVDFWFKSNNAWNTADAMLFDATTVAARPFFLMKRNSGALRFVITDSAGTVRTAETSTGYTFAANTWHHVGVSWNIKVGTNLTVQQIFLDGVLVTTNTTTPFRSTTSGAIAALSTLYFGDNRTSGITPSSGSPNGANGTIDEVYIYAIDIGATQAAADMALTRPTCGTVDHFHIVHNGELVNCGNAVASITVEAHDATHGLISLAGTTMQMSTSTGHGTWSSVSTINPVGNAGGGNGSYTFSNEASIILGLSNTFIEALNINLVSGTVTERSGQAAACVAQDYAFGSICDADLNFAQAGFIFAAAANGAVATIPSQVAGTPSGTFWLRAVKTNTTTKACDAALAGANTVNLAYECNDPTTCSGSNLMSVNGGGATTIARNNNGSVSSYSSVNMTFDVNGNAPFTFNYSDVGRVTLWASKALGSVTLTGNSNAFAVKPGGFVISNIVQTAAPQLANPGAASSGGPKFVKAGENFTMTVTATTTPASGATTTLNYGKEISPETVKVVSALAAPVGGAAGILSGSFGAFANGVATGTTFTWSEVGIITLTPSVGDADYLGAGDTTGTASGNVGRFIPDHFLVSGGALANRGGACTPASNFTYLGEPLRATFTLTARNALATPTVTGNYTTANGFAKLDGTVFTNFGFAAVDLADATPPVGATAFPTARLTGTSSGTWAGGVGSFTADLAVSRTATLEGPYESFQLGAIPLDNDGVTLRTGDLNLDTDVPANTNDRAFVGGSKIRFGRLFIPNTYGTEKLNLAVPVETQYWNGTFWRRNTDDSCTSIAAANLALGNYSASGTPLTSANLPQANATVTTGITSGLGRITVTKPSGAATGAASLAIRLGAGTGAPVVCGTWNSGGNPNPVGAGATYLQVQDGACTNYDRDPVSRITFGITPNKFIYNRENY